VHKHMRTHGSEGATEPGRDGPRQVGPSQPPWPTPGVVRPPFSCTRRTFNPKFVEVPTFTRQRAIRKKKEDTVGSVTMINGAMSSTLMG
jgi:hypothetical protein